MNAGAAGRVGLGRNSEFESLSAFYYNLGLRCLGIEIYLPLSSRLILAMLCPSHRAEREAILARVPPGAKLTERQRDAIAHARRFLSAGASGTPLPLVNANVVHLNSLQVRTQFASSTRQTGTSTSSVRC